MKIKLVFLVLSVAFISAPALADGVPEFDAVGLDSGIFFNDFVQDLVVKKNKDAGGVRINKFSDFPSEFFDTTAAAEEISPCVPCSKRKMLAGKCYTDHKAGAWFENSFEWLIVLQMAPETHLNLNIRDCVLKQGMTNIWKYAQQTGRYRNADGQLIFNKSSNPRISVRAIAGSRSVVTEGTAVYMDAAHMPTLDLGCLDSKLYTSTALWEEGIVLKLPEPGSFNQCGQPMWPLREGDMIYVRIDIPFNNPVDIYYGLDNVDIKYVGTKGLDLTTLD